jgi:drug/metabolite transporter (DMT)-like permease
VVGLAHTTPGFSALINVTIPVTALVCAWLVRAERFDAVRGLGVAAAAGGVVLLVTGRLDADWKLGNLLTLVNACSFGCFLVLSRPVYRRLHPYGATAALFLCGAVMIGAAFGWRIPRVAWGALPGWAWGAMAYTVVGATVLTYALNAFALRHADASVVGFFIFLQPLIAAGVSAAAGGEALGWRFAAAGALVAVGVGVVLRRPVRPPAPLTAARGAEAP